MGVPDSLQAPMEDPPITASLGPIDRVICRLKSLEGSKHMLAVRLGTNQILKLRECLEKFRDPLKSLSEMEDTSFRARWWMKEVRELCYDTDDYLLQSSAANPHRGSWWIRVLLGRIMCWSNSSKLKFMERAEFLEGIAEKSIKEEMEAAISLKKEKRAGIPLQKENKAGISLEKENKADIEGRLVQLLAFQDDKQTQLKMVPIYGFPGAGKTALARTLYVQHRRKFQCRAFVRVPRNPDIRSLLTSILSQIKAPPPDGFSGAQDLIGTINKHLEGKRYFIVIDDVRITSVWDIISHAFPVNNCGSRIILTTQSEHVASACSGYELESTMFKLEALNGCTDTTSKEKNEVLNLKYSNLPLHLKTCLLFLGMYPEGCTITKDDLAKQWVAEEFIAGQRRQGSEELSEVPQDKTEETSEIPQNKMEDISEIPQDKREEITGTLQKEKEEIARGYFDELVTRGMIEPVDINNKGEVLSCTVHHTVLDLIRYKSKEDNFSVVVDNLQSTLRHPDTVRRLSVQLGCDKGVSIPENLILSKVRSLTFHGFKECVPSIADYGILRVLNLHIWGDEDKIFDVTRTGELCHLIYLKIECNITVRLPSKIRRLQHLGTLELHAEVVAVPSDIGHLEKLVHVRCPSNDKVMMDLSNLTNLLDLQLTWSTVENLEEHMKCLCSILKKLSSLRCLTLVPASGSCSVNTLPANALRKCISGDILCTEPTAPTHLQRLELSPRCCIFAGLPNWIGKLRKLGILKIAIGELLKGDIDILKEMPSLTALSLHVEPMPAGSIVFGKEGFSALTYFKFTCTVPQVEFEAGGMPNLERLKLCFDSPTGDEQATTRTIIIGRLLGLKEISAVNGSAGVDTGSAWHEAIKSDQGNPRVQLMGSIYAGDQGRGMEGSGEPDNNEAHVRVHMEPESSRLPVPEKAARCREDEQEDGHFLSEITNIPIESEITDEHIGQVPAASQAVFGSSDPISVRWKDDHVSTNKEKTIKDNTSRFHMEPESSRLPVPEIAAHCREDGQEDRSFISDMTNIQSESESTAEHIGQVPATAQAVFGSSDPISVPLKDDSVYIDPEKMAENNSSRVHMKPESSHLPLPARSREEEPDDQPVIPEIIIREEESEITDWHSSNQVVMHGKQTGSSGNSDGGGGLSQGVGRSYGDGGSLDTQWEVNLASATQLKQESSRGSPQIPIDAATGAVGSLIPKLLELLKEEYRIQTRVKEDVEFLQREMKSMEATLRNVAMVSRDQHDKIWANEARELSYKIEDIVDSFLVRVEDLAPAPDKNTFKGLMNMMTSFLEKGMTRYQIADAVKDIKLQVQDVAKRRDRYKLDVGANLATASTVHPRKPALYKDQRQLVGIEGPRDKLIKMLTNGDDVASPRQQPKSLSICGFAGLGKTTLAKAIYDVMLPQFDLSAFVSVGSNPNTIKVLKDILCEIDSNMYDAIHTSALDERQLITRISTLLQSKRYFIVVDDIWDIGLWEIISCAFMNTCGGSIIVSTTRVLEVAKTTADRVYMLEPLSFDGSKELFCKQLSTGKGKNTYDQSVELSKKILHKCGGVPLAIITIARLLVDKPREDWSEVYNSVGFGDADFIDVGTTRKILLYSYYDLPCHLRTCLLYLSIHPGDSRISKHGLIWKWVAEGFVPISNEQGMGSYEMAEGYFNELVYRNMIQAIEVEHGGTVVQCRVHDLVLDMIYSLSMEDNFVTVLGSGGPHIHPPINARRLAIQERDLEHNDPLVSTPMLQARSFIAVRCRISAMPSLSRFQVLRVLAIDGCTFTGDSYHLEHLGRLLQLRYLEMVGAPITKLPKDIGNLRFLQTLDLRKTKIRELPRSVGLLSKLKCLHLDYDFQGLKDWIGNLTSLEELWLGNVSPYVGKEIGKLTELRDLEMDCISLDAKLFDDLMVSISKLQKLQVIKVTACASFSLYGTENWAFKSYVLSRHLRCLSLPVTFPRLPEWINSSHFPHLANLTVEVETVQAQDMEILGRFQDLISLTLGTDDSSFPDVVGGGAFPKLRHFTCSTKPRFLLGAMPCLEYLCYWVMERWDREQDSIQNLSCLEKIKVYMNSASATDKEEVEAALTHALKIHPNNPTLIKFEVVQLLPEGDI